MSEMRPILYGVSDFAEMRRSNAWYVDRTKCIRDLEQIRFAMFLRPRRFGKSLLVSTLQAYYDVNYADRFEELFAGTDIGAAPTAGHLVLYFNFSAVKKVPDVAQQSFDSYASGCIDAFARRYEKRLPDGVASHILAATDCIDKLNTLFLELSGTGRDIYVFIDEYDNFTNTILAEHGVESYNELCHGDGFFKQFFTVLKATTTSTDAPVKRIFITGVSPVTMDDVTSGFNIAVNISLRPSFADWLGFTHDDLRSLLDYYAPQAGFDAGQAFDTIVRWFDNYRFAIGKPPAVANTSLVLSFVKYLVEERCWPEELIDENLRTDYTKIRHLVTVGRHINGNFHLFEDIINQGKAQDVLLKKSFQAVLLAQTDNFLSLLYYFGILTISDEEAGGVTLAFPNQAVRQMVADFIPDAYRDVFRLDPRLESILKGMHQFRRSGEIDGFIAPLCDVVKQIFAVRDARDGEAAIQAAVVALLTCASGPYLVRHEREANGGYYDIGLAPQLSRWPDIPNAALIELKYFKAGEPAPTAERLAALRKEAAAQLGQYARDQNLAEEWRLKPDDFTSGVPDGTVTLHRIVLAFHGGNCVLCGKLL